MNVHHKNSRIPVVCSNDALECSFLIEGGLFTSAASWIYCNESFFVFHFLPVAELAMHAIGALEWGWPALTLPPACGDTHASRSGNDGAVPECEDIAPIDRLMI